MNDGENFSTTYNPATGILVGTTRLNSVEELQEAVNKARLAQKEWGKLSYSERGRKLKRIATFIANNADDISKTISDETGKTVFDALSTETLATAMAVRFYSKNAKKVLKRKSVKGGNLLLLNKRSYIEHAPFGVIGIISPWNYPFAIPMHEVVMALVAGNAVVLKVASQTLEVGKWIEKAVRSTGIPEELFTLINLPGAIAGDAFIDCGVNKLFFTGSVPVGKYLMKKSAEKLTPLSLELGGNDAMIVCEDTDIFRAVSGAVWGAFSNSGQSCAGIERIYVDSKIYNKFVTLLKERVAELRQGVGSNFNIDIGSMTTKKQLETVRSHVQDAVAKGAKIFQAKSPEDLPENGLFYPPTILENVNNDMVYMQEETFGPVVSVTPFKKIEDAVAMANSTNLGLTASVWTTLSIRGKKTASMLEAGAVTINDHLMSHGLAETPWGGFKESGIGRTHGAIGLEEMTQPRVVVNDLMPFAKRNMWWHPHSQTVYDGLKGALVLLYGSSLSGKVSGLFKLTKVFMRTFSKK